MKTNIFLSEEQLRINVGGIIVSVQFQDIEENIDHLIDFLKVIPHINQDMLNDLSKHTGLIKQFMALRKHITFATNCWIELTFKPDGKIQITANSTDMTIDFPGVLTDLHNIEDPSLNKKENVPTL